MKITGIVSVLSVLSLICGGVVIVPEAFARVAQQQNNNHVDFVKKFSDEVIKVNQNNASPAETKALFVEIAKKYVSLEGISKFLLGAKFRTLGDRKERFVRCVTNLMATRLLAELPHCEGIKVTFEGCKMVSPKHSLVTMSYFVNGENYKLVFSVFDTKRGIRIFDISVNDVSLSQVQRADINGKIYKDGFDAFLRDFFKTYDD